MEENIISAPPAFKLYKDRSIVIGTFIGGPLVAGYLSAVNFKYLGQSEKVKTAWTIAIITTAIIGGTLFIPGIDKIPNVTIPLIYTWITRYLVQKYQGASIKAHMESGGQLFSPWRAVWIGLVGLIVLMAIILAILMLVNKDSI
jgi:hypothetical protein